MSEVGRITQIWRYPVKSMAGERLGATALGPLGVHADRTWAVRDLKLGATTSGKRLAALMQCTARYASEPGPDAGPGHAPEVIIGFPDGGTVSSSDPGVHRALSAFLDRDVELRPLPPLTAKDQYRGPMMTKTDVRTVMGLGPDEPLPDLSMFPVRMLAALTRYATPVGTYADVYPLHLLTEQSLRAMSRLAPDSDFDVRRFRPSVLIAASTEAEHPEWDWCDGVLHAPDASLDPLFPTIRCVMPSRPQGDLPEDGDVTRTIAQHSRRCLGIYGTVPQPGRIAEGDVLTLERTDRSALGARPDALASRVKRVVMRAGTAAMPRGKPRS